MQTYVGDIVNLRLDTRIVLTGYDVSILYRKPNGTTGTWVAAIDGGDNNVMEYETAATDLDLHGTWKLQALAEDPGGTFIGHGTIVELEVFEPLIS